MVNVKHIIRITTYEVAKSVVKLNNTSQTPCRSPNLTALQRGEIYCTPCLIPWR